MTTVAARTLLACAVLLTATSHASIAQEKPASTSSRPGWVRTFDDITVQEVKPADLPTATTPPGALSGYARSEKLPRPATQAELRNAAAHVSPRVIRVVALQTPPRPYRQVPMLYFGHAVWVTPPTAPSVPGAGKSRPSEPTSAAAPPTAPVLLSTWDWLESADVIYALSPETSLEDVQHSPQMPAMTGSAGQRALKSVHNTRDANAWLKAHRHALIPLSPAGPDRHRNLVELKAEKDALAQPKSGLDLFDPLGQALFRLYGFSPYAQDSLIEVQIRAEAPKNPALAFYWQTTFGAILGAPLVAQDARLVALNAFQSPDGDALFMSVPTHAIASYLGAHAQKPSQPPANSAATTSSTPTAPEAR